MNIESPTPAVLEAFERLYLTELDEQVKRSEVVGSITLSKGSAALFYDAATTHFAFVEKLKATESANIYECVPRDQWGRKVLLIGHRTYSGGFIASGHATLNASKITAKLTSGSYYRLEVDDTLEYLQPFVFATANQVRGTASPSRRGPGRLQRTDARPPKAYNVETKFTPRTTSRREEPGDESEDLTAEDIRRLRGEIAMQPVDKRMGRRWN